MFKRILLSLGVITVVGGAAIAGTQALLNDSVELTANTFSTGSVDLDIWDGSAYIDGPITGFTETGLLPGEPGDPHVVWLKNTNTDVALAITAAASALSGSLNPDHVMVTIEARTPDGSGSAGTPVTQSLHLWQNSTTVLPSLPATGEQRYHVTVEVAESVTDENSDAVFNLTFTGTQIPTP